MQLKKLAVLFLGVFLLVSLAVPAAAQTAAGPYVVRAEHHDTSLPLRELANMPVTQPIGPHRVLPARPVHENRNALGPEFVDPVWQKGPLPAVSANLGLNFLGVGNGFPNYVVPDAPPDTNGAVGDTQYVQWVNVSFAIFNKTTGATVLGPVLGNQLWKGFGGQCEFNNSGDIIAQFDKTAHRWVLSQPVFNPPYYVCFAISTTPDATGSYNRYAFGFGNSNFPDYPKLGIWPDAYYGATNTFAGGFSFTGAQACAYDRNKMLAGQAATAVCFQEPVTVDSLLPADMDGSTPPPVGSPNYYVGTIDNANNIVQFFKFHVDFTTPSNSTFTGPTNITVAAFSPLCGGFGACVQQPSPGEVLDSLADRLMYRNAYRNFGDHDALVFNHSVVAGNGGGVRWYEIRNMSTTPTVFQQGTFAPDTNSFRWMGSIAMDQVGNMALGYSRSSSTIFPSILYTGRVPSDPAGQMESEATIINGTGSQFSTANRWGDYSSMSIDPIDDCTFFYTTEYYKTTSSFNWSTQIASLKFPTCGGQGVPAVTLAPKSLSFPKTILGTSSKPLTVKLTNSGSAPLAITSIAPSGDFTQTNNCPMSPNTLAPGAFCKITVTFTPTAINKRTGTISITDNAPDSPQSVPLSGVGTIVTLLPTNFNFGTVTVGQQSNPLTATLTNKSTTTVLNISKTTLTGTAKLDYSIVNNTCVGQINPQGTCVVTVVFKPTLVGRRPATVNVFHDGGGSPSMVSMVGFGQ